MADGSDGGDDFYANIQKLIPSAGPAQPKPAIDVEKWHGYLNDLGIKKDDPASAPYYNLLHGYAQMMADTPRREAYYGGMGSYGGGIAQGLGDIGAAGMYAMAGFGPQSVAHVQKSIDAYRGVTEQDYQLRAKLHEAMAGKILEVGGKVADAQLTRQQNLAAANAKRAQAGLPPIPDPTARPAPAGTTATPGDAAAVARNSVPSSTGGAVGASGQPLSSVPGTRVSQPSLPAGGMPGASAADTYGSQASRQPPQASPQQASQQAAPARATAQEVQREAQRAAASLQTGEPLTTAGGVLRGERARRYYAQQMHAFSTDMALGKTDMTKSSERAEAILKQAADMDHQDLIDSPQYKATTKRAELDAQKFGEERHAILDAAKGAPDKLGKIELQRQMLDIMAKHGFTPGLTAEWKTKALKAAQQMPLMGSRSRDELVAALEGFDKLSTDAILGSGREAGIQRVTQGELLNLLPKIQTGLGVSAEGNRMLLNIQESHAKASQMLAAEARRYAKEHGELDDDFYDDPAVRGIVERSGLKDSILKAKNEVERTHGGKLDGTATETPEMAGRLRQAIQADPTNAATAMQAYDSHYGPGAAARALGTTHVKPEAGAITDPRIVKMVADEEAAAARRKQVPTPVQLWNWYSKLGTGER